MRPIGNSAKGRHRIRQKLPRIALVARPRGLRAWGLTAALVLGSIAAVAGATAGPARATTAPALTTGSWPGASGPQAANQYYGYPYRNAPDCQEDAKHPGINCTSADLDKWAFYQGQCTSWAAYRLNQLTGAGFTDTYKLPKGQKWGPAANWKTAAQTAGIAVNSTPAVGSIAWYSSNHVAVVEHVNSATSIVISEMNTDYHNGFAVHTTTTTGTTTGSGWPTAFIHIKDVPQTLPAQPASLKGSMSSTSAALTWTETSSNVASFVSQYRIGSGSWTAGPSVSANARSMTVTGLKASTTYTFQVGARNAVGTHWSAYYTGKTAAQPTQTPPPAPYHTGRQVKIAANATTGVSGHLGPYNTYASNKATGANQPLWIVCYVTGQSITNSHYSDTTTIWDLAVGGYYYSDAWLYTGTNGAAVPHC